MQSWVQTAYRHLCEKRPWAWLRAESEFLIDNQRTGTVTATYKSATIQGVSLVFVAADAGRQFRVSTTGSPVYTILSVDLILNRATIDRPFGDTTATVQSATILDAYVTLPTDFGRFIAVLDPHNGWRLHIWETDDELNAADAQRSSSGNAFALVSRRLSSLAATTGQVQYELWPYQTTQHNYPYFYIRRPEILSPTQLLPGLLAHRGDILQLGAIAECCDWPGPDAEHRNPYYNQVLARMKRDQFNAEISQLEVRDEEVYMTWLTTALDDFSWVPIDSNFMQSHDAGIVGQTW